MARLVDCPVFTAEPEDVTHEGCPVVTKRRHVAFKKGINGCVDWEMRWRDGKTADFSACFETSTSESASSSAATPVIRVRFGDVCTTAKVLGHVEGEMVDPKNGIVRFCLPSTIYNKSGLYRFEIAVSQEGFGNFFMDNGIISIEDGLFGDTTQAKGPPSMQEIRLHLRDTEIENDLLADVEFDDSEILFAIARPIQKWNEVPPDIHRHTCQSFPYRHHWLNAIAGELMMIAVHHYTRNKMKANAGGLTEDDKNKDSEYTRLAQRYAEEWHHFIVTKKTELNVKRCWSTQGSNYDLGYSGH